MSATGARAARRFDAALLAALLDDPAACVLVFDEDGCVRRANATTRRLLHRECGTPGTPGRALFHGPGAETSWTMLATALSGRSAGPLRVQPRLAEAGESADHAFEAVASPIAATGPGPGHGPGHGMVLRLTDLRAHVALEARLAHGEKLQTVGRLAAGIAHDFNNLLTAILSTAELMLARAALDGESRDDALQIQASAERGAALVRQILAFARRQQMQTRAVALNDAVTAVSGLLRRLVSSRVRLDVMLESPGRHVLADAAQLDQVLINLVVNARDALSGQGGDIRVRTGHATVLTPVPIGPDTMPPGRYVTLEVADDGPGIPAAILPRVFDPFFTTKPGGTGLGLSTVHGIVRQFDGYLSITGRTEPPSGTTVTVWLPRHVPDASTTAPIVAASSPPVGTDTALPALARRVLLVEDEDRVRVTAERALVLRGWQVQACCTAEEALAVAEMADRPDAVVSDVVMPGLDGASLVRALRARWPDLPAVLVSGYADESLRADLAAPDIHFLPKPYTLRALAAALDSVTMG